MKEERLLHPSFPKKQALQAGGGQGRGKGLLPLGSLPEPVTSLEKKLSLLFLAAWGIAGFSRLKVKELNDKNRQGNLTLELPNGATGWEMGRGNVRIQTNPGFHWN